MEKKTREQGKVLGARLRELTKSLIDYVEEREDGLDQREKVHSTLPSMIGI